MGQIKHGSNPRFNPLLEVFKTSFLEIRILTGPIRFLKKNELECTHLGFRKGKQIVFILIFGKYGKRT